jgi:hypothetical protein
MISVGLGLNFDEDEIIPDAPASADIPPPLETLAASAVVMEEM